MAQRGILRSDVLSVLARYDEVEKTPEASTRFIGIPREDGRVLKVWVVGSPPQTDPMIIKSAAWKGGI